MPRCAYIFFKAVLALAAGMLLVSCLLFLPVENTFPERLHLALVLLESPAGVLLVGLIGLAFLLDHS